MRITDVRIRKINKEGRMKAIVSVTFDDAFVVHDIKVIEGQEKLFTAMPSRRTPENEFKDIAHPINSEMRETLEKAIIFNVSVNIRFHIFKKFFIVCYRRKNVIIFP